MKAPGEKGKCLTCEYCSSIDGNWRYAWCMYKNMRLICGPKVIDADRSMSKKEFREKYKDWSLKTLEKRVNPSWCPLRNKES